MKAAPVFRYVHLGALALAVVALPWSEFLLSNALIILLVNWLWEGVAKRDLGARFRRTFTDRASVIWLSFFGLHLLGLLWTTAPQWGLDLCRILLPVPILGLVLSSTPRLSAKELRHLLLLGAWSAVASTVVCLMLRYGALARGEYRDLSPFISHIRLALMLCFSMAVLLHHWPQRNAVRAAHVLAVLWSLYFLVLLSSISGLAIAVVLGMWGLGRVIRQWSLRTRMVALLVLIGGGMGTMALVRSSLSHKPVADHERLDALDSLSAGGEAYYHDRERPQLENGHYVWVNIADEELQRGWARRSNVPFDGPDAKGLPLRTALVRYLSSMGLRKDSIALAELSAEDVARIEQGVTSIRTGRFGKLQARLEQVRYEWNAYRTSGDINGHSITMRIEFQRVGWRIAKEHPLFGVGTGDTGAAFNAAYANGTRLDPKWWLRAHDQYLTWAISFGAIGLLWCLFAWWWPAWRNGAARHALFMAWCIIAVLSCFSEDTLETQMGATFVALYYALFVWAAPITDRSRNGHAPVVST